MTENSRREFLKMVALGAGAVAAVSVIPSSALGIGKGVSAGSEARSTKIDVRAMGGLPQGPFPSYATYVMEGTVDIKGQTGILTKAVFAGPPEAMSTIALPGLSRVIRVTRVRMEGDTIHVSGVVDDRSQLKDGESHEVVATLERSSGTLRTQFLASNTALKLM